MNFYQTFRVFY